MSEWLTNSFQEHSIIWLLISSVIGGIIGASFKYLFDFLLPYRVNQKRDILSIKRKYSTPILMVTDELRKRLDNIIRYIELIEKEAWLKDRSTYYYNSCIFVTAQFLGWRQILRREVVYLDFTTVKESKIYEWFLSSIQSGFSKPDLIASNPASDPQNSDDKWVYSIYLQGIGDAMIMKQDDKIQTVSYDTFFREICQSKEPEYKETKKWLNQLGDIFIGLKKDDIRFRRLVAIHSLINAFINYIDPRHTRTRVHDFHLDLLDSTERKKIDEAIHAIIPKAQFTNQQSGYRQKLSSLSWRSIRNITGRLKVIYNRD